jgi:hypothetical protein
MGCGCWFTEIMAESMDSYALCAFVHTDATVSTGRVSNPRKCLPPGQTQFGLEKLIIAFSRLTDI